MRRLAVHQSLGNLYEDVQRNDSAGVIPRITILVDCCMSIIQMTDTSKLRQLQVSLLYRVQTGIRTVGIAVDRSTNAI